MKRIKGLIKHASIVVKGRLALELFYEFRKLSKYLGEISPDRDIDKFKADLQIKIHSIEKGLSLPVPRVGFGETKINDILARIEKLKGKLEHIRMFEETQEILSQYFLFNEKNGHINDGLKTKFHSVFSEEYENTNQGGVTTISKKSIQDAIDFNYAAFVNNRFSIRDFEIGKVDRDIIYKAMDLAKKSPSACNRQPWNVYVFENDEVKKQILSWQGGNLGFSDCIDKAIVITCSIKSYFIHESHQAYIDGGMYAMSFMYALHSIGIGSIPLTMAAMSKKSKVLYQKYGISDDELPIVMIGVGKLKETFNVAISNRREVAGYVKFI